MTVHIFIETGVPEKKKAAGQFTNEWHFIKQYIMHLFPDLPEYSIDIIDVGGKDKLRIFGNKMRDFSMLGDKNIVIFDCDSLSAGGGIEKRRAELARTRAELKVDFDFFLFPNDRDEGTFEDMLLHIINSGHSGIMDCFSRYEACVGGQNELKGGLMYEMPNVKAKIYTYIMSFRRSRRASAKVKGGDWDFQNIEYWDLDSEYLAPLKAFLRFAFGKG